ncbi:MAG: hypothetical protein AcusKO_25390 [Acuticoccus sp.]
MAGSVRVRDDLLRQRREVGVAVFRQIGGVDAPGAGVDGGGEEVMGARRHAERAIEGADLGERVAPLEECRLQRRAARLRRPDVENDAGAQATGLAPNGLATRCGKPDEMDGNVILYSSIARAMG